MWLGKGKWLVRRLREADPQMALRLPATHRREVAAGDPSDHLIDAAGDVLSAVGARLTEGYRVG